MSMLGGALRRMGWLTAVLVGLSGTVGAQVAPNWTVATAGAVGTMVALDRSNNAYAAGSLGGPSIVLSKISPAGVPLWQRSYVNGGLLSKSTGLTVDAAGNAIVTGQLTDAGGTAQGPMVLKYDAAGTLLWQDVTASTFGQAWRAVTDATGNVYVLARLVQPATGGVLTVDMVLTKYSPTGVRQWVRSYGARGTSGEPLAITPAGNILVTGTGSVIGESLIAAFDPAGNALWSKRVASNDGLNLAVGPAGEFYAVGAGAPGFLVIKHDASFNELWRTTHAVPGQAQRAAVDALGNVVVSGVVDTNTGLLQVVLYDWLTIKLDGNGNLLWTHTYGQPRLDGDVPASMALGADGAAYLTGQGSLATVSATGTTTYTRSMSTLKLAANGTASWLANTTASASGVTLKLGSDGGVLVMGDGPMTVYRYPQSGLANQPPTALASASTSAGPAPLTVTFSAVGSTDPDGSIAGYAWDFGDGQGSSAAQPSHTYAVGSYTARLTVTDNLGAASVAAPIVITANAPALPPAQPTALSFTTSSVVGGSSTTATVTVSSAAGATLLLSSSNTRVAAVPASVVIPVGATRVSFTVTTSKVKKSSAVTIRAAANGASAKATLTVRAR